MLERLFGKSTSVDVPEETYSPYVYFPDFDARIVREMEDEYIRLGHMTEADRMKIPPELEPTPNELHNGDATL